MEEALKTRSDLKINWQQIRAAKELVNKEPNFYSISDSTGFIDVDPDQLLSSNNNNSTYEVKVYNQFVTDIKRVFNHLLEKMNTSSDTEPLISCLHSAIRMDFAVSTTLKKRCVFSMEQTDLLVSFYFHNNLQKITHSRSFWVNQISVAWLKAMYNLKHIMQHLDIVISDNFEACLRTAWEIIYPSQQ